MNRLTVPLGVPLLLIFPALCQAADSKSGRDDAAVEKVVAASMKAASKGDWKAYAELVHPESLQDYKNMWLPLLQLAAKEKPDKQAGMLRDLFGKADPKALIDMKPKEFFATSMKELASSFRALKQQLPVPQESSADIDAKILGTVREGEDLAHVVVRARTKNQQGDVTRVDVNSLKWSGTEWRMLLPEAVRVMAETHSRWFPMSGPSRIPADPDK